MDASILQGFLPSGVHSGGLYQGALQDVQTQQHLDVYNYTQHAENGYEDYVPVGNGEQSGMEDSDATDDPDRDDAKALNYKCKPRRKATQKPVGSDQKRQAFSKRKRGIVLKAYQLYKLTDAKVFMFMVNDKGSSWAYASPSFGASLHPSQLRRLRELAGHSNPSKHSTEVMAHPRMDEADRLIDDRHTFVGALEPLHVKSETRGAPLGPTADPNILAARAAAARDRDAQRNMARVRAQGNGGAPGLPGNGMTSGAAVHANPPGSMVPSTSMMPEETQTGYMGETIITPSGHALAKAVGLGHLMPPTARGDVPEHSMQHTSVSGNSEQQPQAVAGSQHASAFTGQIITDAQGNMYRIIQEAAPAPLSAAPPPTTTYMMQPQQGNMDSLMPQQHQASVLSQQQQQVALHTAATIQHQAQQQQGARGMLKEEPDASVAPGLATLAAAAAAANQTIGGAGTATTSSGGRRPAGQDSHQPQPAQQPQAQGMAHVQPSLGLDGMAHSGGQMLLPASNDMSTQYIPSGAHMTTYMQPQQHYQQNPQQQQQPQIVQMPSTQLLGTNQQHMGSSYTVAAQDMQGGFRSYPAGGSMSVMLVAPDWTQNMVNSGNAAPRAQQPDQWRQ